MSEGTHKALLPLNISFKPTDILLQLVCHGVEVPGKLSEFIP